MLLQDLRQQVLEANLELVRRGLVLYTFGNASGISRGEGLVAIKPSGVPYGEKNTGHAIVRTFEHLDYSSHPGVLVANHGPFTWGADPAGAAHNAAILESLARMAFLTISINREANPIGKSLHDKHYLRKHGRT